MSYLGQIFYPFGLAVLYPHPSTACRLADRRGLLCWLAISAAAAGHGEGLPYLLVGWLWYLVMLVPVIGLVQVGIQAMADRYTYLTQIGLYMAWSGGSPTCPGRGPIVPW